MLTSRASFLRIQILTHLCFLVEAFDRIFVSKNSASSQRLLPRRTARQAKMSFGNSKICEKLAQPFTMSTSQNHRLRFWVILWLVSLTGTTLTEHHWRSGRSLPFHNQPHSQPCSRETMRNALVANGASMTLAEIAQLELRIIAKQSTQSVVRPRPLRCPRREKRCPGDSAD